MSSISALSGYPANQSPFGRIQNQISTEVASGALSSSDATALSGALSDIGSALSSQFQANATSGGSPPDRSTISSTISGLIDNEVSAGKLTATQAGELEQLFAQNASGPHRGHHGHHAHRSQGNDSDGDDAAGVSGAAGAGGSSASSGNTIEILLNIVDSTNGGTSSGATPSSTSGVSATDPVSGTSGTSATSSTAADVQSLLQDFLKVLQDSQPSLASYSAGGTSQSSLTNPSLVLNLTA